MGYTLRMSVTHQKSSSKHFDNVAALRALQLARQTLDIEAEAILALKARLSNSPDDAFARAVALLLGCGGRVVVSGMGKSGHIARKIAATLASTGTPALFVHPAEAAHGDLGMVTEADAVIVISNSGESEELLAIVPVIKRIGAKLISMTGRPQSTLATLADVVTHLPSPCSMHAGFVKKTSHAHIRAAHLADVC
jgi:arabinose-5-phosphate isomerase